MTQEINAIDCFVNTSALLNKDFYASRVGYLFGEVGNKPGTPAQLVREMDIAGIEKAVLVIDQEEPALVIKAIKKYPDRFIGGQSVNPLEEMEALRKLERAVKDYGFKAVYGRFPRPEALQR